MKFKFRLVEAKELSRGAFWVVDGELLAFPFVGGSYTNGVAKSGLTYNHEKLWDDVKPKGCNKSFDYYPRGRVEIGNNNNVTIYMNPNVGENIIPQIKTAFGIVEEPRIIYDYSNHYKCYLDDGYREQTNKEKKRK